MNTTTNNRKEQWKAINGFDGKYEVSNRGRIRSLNYNNTGMVKILRASKNQSTGYMQVGLYEPSTQKNMPKYVHRLVAEAFIPNPKNLEQVDHIDGNKQRNCKSNLRWVSRKFNNSRKRAKMLRAQNMVRKTSHKHQFVKATKGDEVRYFKGIVQASKALGFSHVLGIKVIRGDFKYAKGWTLEYIDRKSTEGMNANVDVRKKSDILRERRKILKAQRKAHVKEMHLPPKMAHCVIALNPATDEIALMYPNIYKAQQDTGFSKIMDAVLGLRERAGCYKWAWLFE